MIVETIGCELNWKVKRNQTIHAWIVRLLTLYNAVVPTNAYKQNGHAGQREQRHSLWHSARPVSAINKVRYLVSLRSFQAHCNATCNYPFVFSIMYWIYVLSYILGYMGSYWCSMRAFLSCWMWADTVAIALCTTEQNKRWWWRWYLRHAIMK